MRLTIAILAALLVSHSAFAQTAPYFRLGPGSGSALSIPGGITNDTGGNTGGGTGGTGDGTGDGTGGTGGGTGDGTGGTGGVSDPDAPSFSQQPTDMAVPSGGTSSQIVSLDRTVAGATYQVVSTSGAAVHGWISYSSSTGRITVSPPANAALGDYGNYVVRVSRPGLPDVDSSAFQVVVADPFVITSISVSGQSYSHLIPCILTGCTEAVRLTGGKTLRINFQTTDLDKFQMTYSYQGSNVSTTMKSGGASGFTNFTGSLSSGTSTQWNIGRHQAYYLEIACSGSCMVDFTKLRGIILR